MCLLRFVRADEINYLYNFVFRDYLVFRSFEKNSSLVINPSKEKSSSVHNFEDCESRRRRREKAVVKKYLIDSIDKPCAMTNAINRANYSPLPRPVVIRADDHVSVIIQTRIDPRSI